MSIFTNSIESISYDDIILFCQQNIKETVNLDYKVDFPSDLTKVISAFANTFGGLIIIGVDENDGRPNPPFIGIDYADGLQERVINMCIDSIYPPIAPDVGVCKGPNNKAFVLIRVPESLDTPHAIQSNTRAYIRTGNINKPEDALNFEQLEWLIKGRNKAIELRNSLFIKANDHLSNLTKYRKSYFSKAVLKLFCSPSFPHSYLINSPDFLILMGRCSSHNTRHFPFPPEDVYVKPMNSGMYSYQPYDNLERSLYFELTQYGSLYCVVNLNWKSPGVTDRRDLIWIDRLVTLVTQFLDYVALFYSQIEYNGYTYFHFSLSNILGMQFIPFNSGNSLEQPQNIVENALEYTFYYNAFEMSNIDTRTARIAEIVEKTSWALGHSIPIEQIISAVNNVRRR